MTTDPFIEVAINANHDNDVYSIRHTAELGSNLAAALLLTKSNELISSHAYAMEVLYNKVLSCMPNAQPWILLSNGSMVRPSRIIQHHKLWRGLQNSGIALPSGTRTMEHTTSTADGIQFFGAIKLDNVDFDEIATLMSCHSSAYFMILQSNPQIEEILKTGWSYEPRHPPIELLHSVASNPSFLILPLGKFDDIESGAVILSTPSLIKECFEDR